MSRPWCPPVLTLPTLALLVAAAGTVSACSVLEPSLGPPIEDAGDLDAGVVADDDGGAPSTDGGDVDVAPRPVSFHDDIRPLMERSDSDPTGHGCKKCHYATEPSHIGTDLAGLDLSTLGALRKGGHTSAATIVVPGNPAASAIVQKLHGTYATGVRMPFSGPPYWSAAQIALVERWIAEGAKGGDAE
jgi:Planctomycete cytochrome C